MDSFYGDSPSEAGSAQDARSLLENAKRHLQSQKNFNLDVLLRMWEQSYVEAALQITHGNLSQASKLLGIHRTTLYSRMQNYERVEER
jgi:DNA-binding NtrC family response regulator